MRSSRIVAVRLPPMPGPGREFSAAELHRGLASAGRVQYLTDIPNGWFLKLKPQNPSDW